MTPEPPVTSGAIFHTTPWRRRRTWLWAVVLAILVVIPHSPGLRNDFNYDDQSNIVENPHFRGLGPAQLRWMFTTFHMGHYQPLSWVTLGLDYLLWGNDPFGYHLTNLVLHVANAVCVYLLALAFLARPEPRTVVSGPRGAPSTAGVHFYAAALLAALFFALHPLRVESVAWVTERRDVLSSFFLLLSLLMYLHAHSSGAARRRGWLACALLVYLLSLLSRAMGVTLPIILLLLDWYPLRRIGRHAGGWLGTHTRPVYREKLLFLVPAIAFAIIAPLAQRVVGAALSLADHSVPARLAQAVYGLVFYIWKTLLPLGLVPMYQLDDPLKILTPKYVLSALAVVGGALLLLLFGRRRPWLVVVVATHAILLAPVLGFFQSGPQEVADRYSYLPAVGWALLMGAGLLRIGSPPGAPRSPARTLPVVVLAGAVLVACGVLTWRQTLVWRTPEALWLHAVRHAPSATTHQNLAGIYAQTGRLPDAITQYRAALLLEPRHELSLLGLAKALTDTRQLEEATRAWEVVLRYDPGHIRSRLQYALVLRARGLIDEAVREYQEVMRRAPDDVEPYVRLGTIALERRQLDEAARFYRRAAEIEPHVADHYYNLANVFAQQRRLNDAIANFEAALARRPDFPEAQNNLGVALEDLGRTGDALEIYERVLRAHPEHLFARYNRARALETLGRRDEARAELHAILRRDPTHVPARQALELLESQPSPAAPPLKPQ